MIQAAQAVVNTGNRLLTLPNAIEEFGTEGARMRTLIGMLEAALSRYPDNGPPSRPIPGLDLLPKPCSAPPARSPLLGIAIADDTVIIIVMVLIVLTKAAIDAGNSGRHAPKIKIPDLLKPMDPLLVVAHLIMMMELLHVQSQVKNIINKVNECKERHPDRKGPCADLLQKFGDISSKLLQRITALRHPRDPVSQRSISKSVSDLKEELADITSKLADCMGCDK
jgi:hypothetical protein